MKLNNSYLKNYKNLKVLVTGTTGFKGAWLANWLSILGAKVIGVSLKPEKVQYYLIVLNLIKKLNNIILT